MIEVKVCRTNKEKYEEIYLNWLLTHQNFTAILKKIDSDENYTHLFFNNKDDYEQWKKDLKSNDVIKSLNLNVKNGFSLLRKYLDNNRSNEIVKFFIQDRESLWLNKDNFKDDVQVIDGKQVAITKYEAMKSKYDTLRKKIGPSLFAILDIASCPICNMNIMEYFYIQNSSSEDGETEIKAIFKGTLDHYLPKDNYSCYSICLYNLIPVCQTCNHIKSDKDSDNKLFHPFFDKIESKYKYFVKPYDKKNNVDLFNFSQVEEKIYDDYLIWEGKSDNFNIIYQPNTSDDEILIKDANSIYHLNSRINQFKYLAQDMIEKSYIYISEYINEIQKINGEKELSKPEICNRHDEIMKMIYKTSIDTKYTRTFSKFTEDMIEFLRIRLEEDC